MIEELGLVTLDIWLSRRFDFRCQRNSILVAWTRRRVKGCQ